MPVNKGNLRIGKCIAQYPQEDYIVIELNDEASGCRVFDIRLSLQEAAKVILFNSQVDVDVEWYAVDRIGKKRELLQASIPDLPWSERDRWAEHVEEQLAEYAAEGWDTAGISKTYNHHHSRRDGTYGMTLVRFVDAD